MEFGRGKGDLLTNWWNRTIAGKWMSLLRGKPLCKLKFAKHQGRSRSLRLRGGERDPRSFLSKLLHFLTPSRSSDPSTKGGLWKTNSPSSGRSLPSWGPEATGSAAAMQAPEQVNRVGPCPETILLPRCHLVVISSKSVPGESLAIC